jgi:hypothetical protein
MGYGLCWSLTSIGTQTVVSPDRAGEASGVTLAIVVGVAGVGVALGAALIEVLSGGGGGQGHAIEDILRVLAVGSAVFGAGLVLSRGRAPRRAAVDAV